MNNEIINEKITEIKKILPELNTEVMGKLVKICREIYDIGYDNGYDDGYPAGNQEGEREGFQMGYRKGGEDEWIRAGRERY